MTLTIDDVVIHYVLSSHPRNRAIVDIKNKKTGELAYIKIRHRLPNFYAVSLVDPVTFDVWAETQVKRASSRTKPIILHLDNAKDVSVDLQGTSRLGFEWSFVWEGEVYKWVRESRISNSLECRAVRKSGDICVAQYLPRVLKDEYFGIFSLLGYNILRCNLTKSRELELIILMSLATLLDKWDDGGWKRDAIGKGVVEEGNDLNTVTVNNPVPSIVYEDPIPKKSQQKKYKAELDNDLKLQNMLERDVKRSQKQIQLDQKLGEQQQKKISLSAGNSPAHTPKGSPLPTPSTSTTIAALTSPRLARQKSAGNLGYTHYSASNSPNISNRNSAELISPPYSNGNSQCNSNGSSAGKLSKLLSGLTHIKTQQQPNEQTIITPIHTPNASPVEKQQNQRGRSNTFTSNTTSHSKNTNKSIEDNSNRCCMSTCDEQHQQQLLKQKSLEQKLLKYKLLLQSQYKENEEYYQKTHPYYDHQLSLPSGSSSGIMSNEFANLSLGKKNYDSSNNPPSLRSIRWDTNNSSEQAQMHSSPQISRQQLIQQQSTRGNRQVMNDSQRRSSGADWSSYSYYPQSRQQQLPQHNTVYTGNNSYRYSGGSSDYYSHAYRQQQHYDYY